MFVGRINPYPPLPYFAAAYMLENHPFRPITLMCLHPIIASCRLTIETSDTNIGIPK
jgi:hypothetical protein